MPYADKLPTADEVVDNGFAFAGKVLDNQKAFAGEVLDATAPVREQVRRPDQRHQRQVGPGQEGQRQEGPGQEGRRQEGGLT